jgi:transposase-like protein
MRPRYVASRRSGRHDWREEEWLWRAIDQDGHVVDEIVQSRRNTEAAKRLLTVEVIDAIWSPCC